MTRSALTLTAILALAPQSKADVVTITPTQDNSIYSESGTLSNGAGTFLFTGQNSFGNRRRALLRFEIVGSVPAGATIHSVELVLHVSNSVSGPLPASVHRVLVGWGEGASDAAGAEGSGGQAMVDDATWSDRFFGVALPWTTPGGDFAAVASTTVAIHGIGTYTFPSTSAMVADAQAMLDTPVSDVGWIVIGDEQDFGTAKRFDSRENPTAAFRPKLVVDYTPACRPPLTYCTAAPNSASPAGAQIGWLGVPALGANGFSVIASGLPANATGIFHFGTSQVSAAFGNGVRCVGGSVLRMGQQTATNGIAQRLVDFGTYPGNVIAAGSRWHFQFWYRDPAAGGANFNLSNGLDVLFCP